jgi:RNA polymerase sigma-70 factor (ECF subfamily)
MIAAAHMAAIAPSAPPGRELDRATLLRCKASDPVAFRAFVVRYERPVFALLSRLLGRGPHVEELAQEAFLKAYRALPGFDLDGAARPSTWMLTIATRLAIDARKRRAVPLEPLDAAEHAAHHATPETESGRAELGRAIARAAAQLSDDQRAVFVLAEFHDLGMAEIASILEVPEATVKTRLFRARERLRQLLQPLFTEAK